MLAKHAWKRIFLLEPNLRKPFGHSAEFPFNLQTYLLSKGIDCVVIGNQGMDQRLRSSSRHTYPTLTQTNFENLDDGGMIFSQDLNAIDEKFHLSKTDLLIILTSYTNEIMGAGSYLKHHNKEQNSPTIAIWIHQLFPLTKEFAETLQPEFQKKIHKKLKKALEEIVDHKTIYLFTPPSGRLQNIYSQLAKKSVGILPLPYVYDEKCKLDLKTPNMPLTFGFLGDGRYEKGMIIILQYIAWCKDQTNRYVLQDIFPRGYTEKQMNEYHKLKSEIGMYPNVSFINEPMSSSEYKRHFSRIDACLLPYHPGSYDKRISGIWIEVLINGKPVVTSEGTWMAKEMQKYQCGTVFTFDPDVTNRLLNFQLAISTLKGRYLSYQQNAVKAGEKYHKIHNPHKFIETLFSVTR